MNSPGNKDRRATWDDESLRRALDAIKVERVSTYKASERYGIPRRTLRRYLETNCQVKAKLGSKYTLTDDQNDELVDRLLELSEQDRWITAKLLRAEAYRFCEERGIKHHFSAQTKSASYKWVRGFLLKNPRFARYIYKSGASRKTAPQMNELDVPAELSGISETELHQHAMSLCESLLAEYSSNSEDVIEIKEEEDLDDGDYGQRRALADENARQSTTEATSTAEGKQARGRQWSVKSLKEAMEAVRSKKLTTHTAALRYKIPRSTLRRYVTKESTLLKSRIGVKVIFNERQNAAFCGQIRDLSRQGYTCTSNFLRAFVYKFCEENGIKHAFSKEKKEASYKWMLRYMRRNPELIKYVHKNSANSKTVPSVEEIVPIWVPIEDEDDEEDAATGSTVEQQVFVDCASPSASVQELSDGELSPKEDPLGTSTGEETKKNAKWTQAALARALDAIKTKNVSTHQAAKIYKIPRSTLRRYFISENNSKSKIGNRSLLSGKQEAEICAELANLSDNGIPLTMKTIKSRVFEYCEKNGVKHSFSKEKRMATYKIVRGLLRRNPTLGELVKRPFNNADFETVLILDEGVYKPTFVECGVDIDHDSSREEEQASGNDANDGNQDEKISFPESIGLFEMVAAGAYGVS